MSPGKVHKLIRATLAGCGICCLALALIDLSHWAGYRKTDCSVETYEMVKSGTTNIGVWLPFKRPSGAIGVVANLPRDLRPGARVSVLYHPDHGYGVIYSFGLVWGTPLRAILLGTGFILVSLLLRRRPDRHLNTNAYEV
jgi:hypothetical protein